MVNSVKAAFQGRVKHFKYPRLNNTITKFLIIFFFFGFDPHNIIVDLKDAQKNYVKHNIFIIEIKLKDEKS